VRKRIALTVFAILLIYAGVAFSGLPERLGRDNPQAASYFRPPLFNFSATYTSGRVLNFQIGGSREEFLSALVAHYGRTAVLSASCGTSVRLNVADSFVQVKDAARSRQLLERDLICVDLVTPKVLLFVTLGNGNVEKIEVDRVNFEGT
jgi:hypothetical protein